MRRWRLSKLGPRSGVPSSSLTLSRVPFEHPSVTTARLNFEYSALRQRHTRALISRLLPASLLLTIADFIISGTFFQTSTALRLFQTLNV